MNAQPFRGNPFHLLQARAQGSLSEAADREWEHARVCYAMGRVGLASARRAMIRRQGCGWLTFAAFHEAFPDFPIRLGCSRLAACVMKKRAADGEMQQLEIRAKPLHLDERAYHPNWFKKFLSLPFMSVYNDLFDSLGEVNRLQPVGLVFPRRGFAQGLVVHNGDVDYFVASKSGCHLYVGGGDRPMNLVVQPFQVILDQICKVHRWTPADRSVS